MRLFAVFADHSKLCHATVDDRDASDNSIQQFSPVNNNLLTCTYQKRFSTETAEKKRLAVGDVIRHC